MDKLNNLLKKCPIQNYVQGYKEVFISATDLYSIFSIPEDKSHTGKVFYADDFNHSGRKVNVGDKSETELLKILSGKKGSLIKAFFRKKGFSIKRKAFTFSPAHYRESNNSFIVVYFGGTFARKELLFDKYIRILVY